MVHAGGSVFCTMRLQIRGLQRLFTGIGTQSRSASKLTDRGEGLQYSKHLVDRRRVHVFGGHGGKGSCLFKKHAKHHLIGPGYPCGGHGGKGGDVIVRVTDSHFSLAHVTGENRADSGMSGRKRRLNGTSGLDHEIHVPRGTIVREMVLLSEEERTAVTRSATIAGVVQDKWREGDIYADLDRPGDRVVVALGGRGGLGNNMADPYNSTDGVPGEERWIELELKSIADVGLIGMPNAGKSTVLGAVSRACPRIAPYPFTTVAPYIGRVEFRDGTGMTIADVPGIVEGAHKGDGLGLDFLRHLERTKVLLYVIDVGRNSNPLANFEALRAEVAAFSHVMAEKPCGIIANKCDLEPEKTLQRVDELYNDLLDSKEDNPPLFIRALSARFGDGIPGLLKELHQILKGEHPACPVFAED